MMEHRHLDVPADRPVEEWGLAALDDLLERGDLVVWRPLVAAVRRDPWGPVAGRVLRLCAAHDMYGTSPLWIRFVAEERARRRAVG